MGVITAQENPNLDLGHGSGLMSGSRSVNARDPWDGNLRITESSEIALDIDEKHLLAMSVSPMFEDVRGKLSSDPNSAWEI
ncbi:hypothetical protein L484_007374 [Morus notabilis]|uniref:Uncharacterized protein n=1 Tax=Morus notabilis TaxID=981085 RepID=W9SQH0_9ROSA|nr:hypothetical protein L484_007374 [Morus notabilis]